MYKFLTKEELDVLARAVAIESIPDIERQLAKIPCDSIFEKRQFHRPIMLHICEHSEAVLNVFLQHAGITASMKASSDIPNDMILHAIKNKRYDVCNRLLDSLGDVFKSDTLMEVWRAAAAQGNRELGDRLRCLPMLAPDFKWHDFYLAVTTNNFTEVTKFLQNDHDPITPEQIITMIFTGLDASKIEKNLTEFRKSYFKADPRPYIFVDDYISEQMIAILIDALPADHLADNIETFILHAITSNNTGIYKYLCSKLVPKVLPYSATRVKSLYFLDHMLHSYPEKVAASDFLAQAAKANNFDVVDLLLGKITFSDSQIRDFVKEVSPGLMLRYLYDPRFTKHFTEPNNIASMILQCHTRMLNMTKTIEDIKELFSYQIINQQLTRLDTLYANAVFESLIHIGSSDLLKLFVQYNNNICFSDDGKINDIILLSINRKNPELLDFCIQATKLESRLDIIDQTKYQKALSSLELVDAVSLHRILCKYESFKNSNAASGFEATEKIKNNSCRMS